MLTMAASVSALVPHRCCLLQEAFLAIPLVIRCSLHSSSEGPWADLYMALSACIMVINWAFSTHLAGEQVVSRLPRCPQGLAQGLTGSPQTVNDEPVGLLRTFLMGSKGLFPQPRGLWRLACHRPLFLCTAVIPRCARVLVWNQTVCLRVEFSLSWHLRNNWHLFEQRFSHNIQIYNISFCLY